MSTPNLYRLSAFSDQPAGGNPAGVWIGDALPEPDDMQQIAAEVGFSETAFVAPRVGTERIVRYFSPEAEVTFCGHATIAAGVVLGGIDGPGTFVFSTSVGDVIVAVTRHAGHVEASLTSVEPRQRKAPRHLVREALSALGWEAYELDPSIPPVLAYAGAWHLVLAVAELSRLEQLDYDFEGLKQLMLVEDLTTLQLIWRQDETTFWSRNPFPVGGVVEDPATGAAAAALGGYLRKLASVDPPTTITIFQGQTMGRPSTLTVQIPASGGIVVTGTAVALPTPA